MSHFIMLEQGKPLIIKIPKSLTTQKEKKQKPWVVKPSQAKTNDKWQTGKYVYETLITDKWLVSLLCKKTVNELEMKIRTQ